MNIKLDTKVSIYFSDSVKWFSSFFHDLFTRNAYVEMRLGVASETTDSYLSPSTPGARAVEALKVKLHQHHISPSLHV